jgi:hypothetical protein
VVLVGIRFHLLVHSGPDFNYQGDIAGIFSALEVHLGIVSACLPVLSPAIRQIYLVTSGSSTWQRLVTRISDSPIPLTSGKTIRSLVSRSSTRKGSDAEGAPHAFSFFRRRSSAKPLLPTMQPVDPLTLGVSGEKSLHSQSDDAEGITGTEERHGSSLH